MVWVPWALLFQKLTERSPFLILVAFLGRLGHRHDSIVCLPFAILTSRVVASVVIIMSIITVLVVALAVTLVVVVLAPVTTRLKPLYLLVFVIRPGLYHDLERLDIFVASHAKILEHPTVIETVLEAIYDVLLRDVHDSGLLVEKPV